MEGITEPVPRPLQVLLRRAVLDHVGSERRRTFPPLLHLGVPGRREEVVGPAFGPASGPESGPAWDLALRTDALAALLRRTRHVGPAPLVWLTRPGSLELEDVDAAWLAAARAACAEAALPLTMVVVTRRGWRDPRSGVRREWRWIRAR